jgi:signal transduction histidine kinase
MSSKNAAESVAVRGLLPTSALQLSFVYVCVFALCTSLVVGLLYLYALRTLDRATDDVIEAELQGLAEQYQAGGLGKLAAVIRERVETGGSSTDVYLLVDPGLAAVAGNIAVWPSQGTAAERWIEFEVSVIKGRTFESRTVRAGVFLLAGGYRLLVGTDIRDREAFKSRIGWTLLTSLLTVILVGGLLGAWMNRHLLRRVDAISAAGREIVDGNFSQRLPRSGTGDELDTLASNLNEMLDRVEQLTAALRFVIDATAHDLRGPLNRMRARIESGLSSAGPDASRQALEETLRDTDALDRTLDALLRIAQAQGGAAAAEIAPLDLGTLAAEVVELYEPAAEERRIELRAQDGGPAIVRGSRQLLAHALANLIDNALKFTPEGGRVDVQVVRAQDSGLQLIVSDNGPGIPAADRVRALERSVRLAGSEQAPGSGLGLSLVAAVARMHHAVLELGDNLPGLRVVLRFPVAAVAAVRP